MSRYTVTITRQFGSLGRPIAKRMAELLGIEFYDRDIVEETAKKMGLSVQTVSNEEEAAKTGFFRMGLPLGSGTTEMQDKIFDEQAKIIQELTEHGSSIIVGRCSDYILRDNKNTIHMSIYAPYEARLRNCVDILHMEEDEAKKMIAKVDKARDSYHKNYAKYLPFDYNNKDVMIDSSLLGIEGTAKVLAGIVKARFNLEE